MLLEPSKPKPKWRWILSGHMILYVIFIISITVAESYFYNTGDAAIVYITAGLLTIFSYLINKMHIPDKALLLTLCISPVLAILSQF